MAGNPSFYIECAFLNLFILLHSSCFTIQIGLSPWANYTFHVRAKNSLGMSDRSEFTTVVCKTQASIPMKNPDGVCTDSRDPSELVITWKVCIMIYTSNRMFVCCTVD